MQPPQRRPSGTPIVANGAAPLTANASPKLARMLLPGERVTFGSTPHPIVFVSPLAGLATAGAGFALAPLFLAGIAREAAIVAALALGAYAFVQLARSAARFAGLRIVATNRRIFAIRGLIVRRITPLGNTALAASTLSQGFLGRTFGYGSIHLPLADGTPGRFSNMRDALQLYREFQAVANGVDGEEWKPAVRQTIIP